MEVGGIENGRLGNLLNPFKLRSIMKNANDFQFLFGFVWLCLFSGFLHPMWHKYGTSYQ
jgi:hypothetical protein